MAKMGMDFGLPMSNGTSRACKRKFRWLFKIEGVSGYTNSLPPMRSERPSLSFRETPIQHLNETIYIPVKPEWKPVSLVLYDVKTRGEHPVFKWLKDGYDPKAGQWYPVTNGEFLKEAKLELYDGCGNVIETWVYENAWPQVSEFGELDMGNQELVTAQVTMRYARAFVQ